MVFNDTNPAGSRSGQETSQKERGAMAEDRFDTLTHRLATASMSRRDVIGVIGGVFAGAVASTSFGTARNPPSPGPRSGLTSTANGTRIRCRRGAGNVPER
jgi:hypothetical protein